MRSLVFSIAFSFLPLLAGAETILVTNDGDRGSGSLRDAINRANSGNCTPCAIEFRIPPPVPASGWFTIHLRSPLPAIVAGATTIDGATQTAFTGDTNPLGPEIEIEGSQAGVAPGLKLAGALNGWIHALAINRCGGNGIVVDGGQNNLIDSNFIGVDPTAAVARSNGFNGVVLVNTSRASVSGNVIAGNKGNGVLTRNCNTCGVGLNRIGMGRDESFVIPNEAHGVDFDGVGGYVDDNYVAFNALNGVMIGPGSSHVLVVNNRIFENGFVPFTMSGTGLPISGVTILSARSLPHVQGYAGFVAVTGTLSAQPNATYYVEVFASPRRSPLGLAEARRWVGETKVVTDGAGHAAFELSPSNYIEAALDLIVPGGFVAVQLEQDDMVSELSEAVPLETAPSLIEVSSTDDDGPGSLRAAIETANASTCTANAPCWISFHVDGHARFEPASALPAIATPYLVFDGASQWWWNRGDRAEVVGAGLQFGSGEKPIHLLLARSFDVRGAKGDGVAATSDTIPGVTLDDVRVEGSAGNGIAMRNHGGDASAFGSQFTTVKNSVASANGGNGVVLDGTGFRVATSTIGGNVGHGVFVTNGTMSSIDRCVIAHNGGSGVATSPTARAVVVTSQSFDNALLPIDRNADGPTPNDAGEADGVTNKPELISAAFDPLTKLTILRVRGVTPGVHPLLPISGPATGTNDTLTVFASDHPDQAERFANTAIYTFAMPAGDADNIGIFADLRGKYLTAVHTLGYCYWEAGCLPRDTSELSNAVIVGQ